MARTVEKIMKDDEAKAKLGVDDEKDDIVLVEGEDADGGAEKGPTPEEMAADLKQQLVKANERADREAAARADAEKRASTASTTAGNAVQSQIATQEAAIVGKISAAKTELDSIKSQLKQAKAAGDSDAEVELSDALINARNQLNAAEWEKGNFERWKEAQTKAPAAAADASPYTVKERAWIAAHPEFNKNKRFARISKAAAQEAKDEGHEQDSDGYFQYIEDALREENLLKDAAEPLSGAGDNNASSSVAAAPNRTGNSGAPMVNKNSKYPYVPNGFRIPADWVQAAEDQGFDDPREYANDRLKIEAEEKAAR